MLNNNKKFNTTLQLLLTIMLYSKIKRMCQLQNTILKNICLLIILFYLFSCSREQDTTTNICGTITDIDGNTYNTIQIGTQCWMKENLKTTHYKDGSIIQEVQDSIAWSNIYNTNAKTAAWCYYNMDSANNSIYGKLYNWHAVNNGKLAPAGWHVPTDNDWEILVNYLNASIAGSVMKDTVNLWTVPNIANNSSGFSCLPAGYRLENGKFLHINDGAYFWSSTFYNDYSVWFRSLGWNSTNVGRNNITKEMAVSVRCLKD